MRGVSYPEAIVLNDWRTATHECGHALAVELLGGRTVLVRGSRHVARDDGERGSCEWYGDLSPHDEATVLLSGRVASEGLDALLPGDSDDERRARALCPLGWQKALAAAWALFSRRDTRRALHALTIALEDSNFVLTGPYVRQVIREALAEPDTV